MKIGDQNYTNFLDDMMIEEGILKFSIDNFYDVIAIRFNSIKTKGLLVFKSLTDKYAVISERYSRLDKQIDFQYEYVFDIYKYETLAYIYGDINDYEYEVILYEKDKYTNTDSPFLLETFEWTDDVVLSGLLPNSEFRIDVKAGYIKFESENVIGNPRDFFFEIYDEDMNPLQYNLARFNNEYYVEAGKYYIKVRSYRPIIGNIRYTFRGVEQE